jgi:hypothetical protein
VRNVVPHIFPLTQMRLALVLGILQRNILATVFKYLNFRVILIIIIYYLISDIDPIQPIQTTLYIGETYKFTRKKPLIY